MGGQERRWKRWKLTVSDVRTLQARLAENAFPTLKERRAFAAEMGVTPRQVQVWFQNQRQRAKSAEPVHRQILETSLRGFGMTHEQACESAEYLVAVLPLHDRIRVVDAALQTMTVEAVAHAAWGPGA